MDQIILNRFREGSEKKFFYCDTCNSLLPAPGFYCVQCDPPQGPSVESEGTLTFSQAALRIVLITILFLAIAFVKLDKYIMKVVSSAEKEVQIKLAEDEDFKLIFKVNTRVANLRNLPKIKTSKVIDTLKLGTQVEIVDTEGDWSKVIIKSELDVEAKTGWIATKLLKSEIK
tara:strand:- start:398 stop:913 length:516 start_codon:yes stop_codon:yes gene_type:complete